MEDKELLENDNQIEENSLVHEDYLIPEDIEEDETLNDTTEEVDEPEVSEETVEETKTESTEEVEEETTELGSLEDLEVKFLHDTKALKDIPRDELKAYVQKGMNHDRIQDKLNTANETINDFKDIADMFDMDVNSIIDTLKTQYYSNKAEKEGRKLEDVKREYESNKKDRNTKMFDSFIDKYPDIKTEDIPQSVMDSVKEGANLVTEYEKYLKNEESASKDSKINELEAKLAEFEKKLNTQTQNKKVKQKGVVKKVSESDSADDNDPFLQGFWGND